MEKIRSFIAIKLPQDAIVRLAAVQAELRQHTDCPVQWVAPQGIHLTLKFLGNISTSQIPQITGALEDTVKGITPFSLAINGLGFFPGPARIQVVWIGIKGQTEILAGLQTRLEKTLARLGFPAEKKPFRPHLTLGRVRDRATPAARQNLIEAIAKSRAAPDATFAADALALMQSTLTPAGAIYQQLASIMLQ